MQPLHQTLLTLAPQEIFTETEIKIEKQNIRDLNVQLCSCATSLFFTCYRAYENEDLNLRHTWIMLQSFAIGFTAIVVFTRQLHVSHLKKMKPMIEDQVTPTQAKAIHLKYQKFVLSRTMRAHFQIFTNFLALNFTKNKIYSSTDDTLQCCTWIVIAGAETLLISKIFYNLFKSEFEKH